MTIEKISEISSGFRELDEDELPLVSGGSTIIVNGGDDDEDDDFDDEEWQEGLDDDEEDVGDADEAEEQAEEDAEEEARAQVFQAVVTALSLGLGPSGSYSVGQAATEIRAVLIDVMSLETKAAADNWIDQNLDWLGGIMADTFGYNVPPGMDQDDYFGALFGLPDYDFEED